MLNVHMHIDLGLFELEESLTKDTSQSTAKLAIDG